MAVSKNACSANSLSVSIKAPDVCCSSKRELTAHTKSSVLLCVVEEMLTVGRVVQNAGFHDLQAELLRKGCPRHAQLCAFDHGVPYNGLEVVSKLIPVFAQKLAELVALVGISYVARTAASLCGQMRLTYHVL